MPHNATDSSSFHISIPDGMSSSENNGKLSSTSLEDLNTRTDREYKLKQEWLGAKKQEEAARADLIQHNQGGQPKQKNNGLKYCNSSKTPNNTEGPLEDIGEEDHDDHDTPLNEISSHAIHTPQSVLRNSETTSPFLNKLRNWLRSPA